MRVLAAIDFNDSPDLVVAQAKDALRGESGTLALCHVIPFAHETTTLFPELHQGAMLNWIGMEKELREAVRQRMLALLDGAEGELFVEQGKPYARCLHRADEWHADLIVVGNHSKGVVEHALTGSTAERIARHAHCSVLVARPAPKSGVVLVATDLSDPSLPAVRAAAAEARLRGARLVVLSVIDWSGAAWMSAVGTPFGIAPILASTDLQRDSHDLLLQTLAQALERFSAAGEPRVMEGDPAASIVKCANELNAELVVVGTHGKTGLARLALGSVAETVIQTASCPVLAVRLTEPE